MVAIASASFASSSVVSTFGGGGGNSGGWLLERLTAINHLQFHTADSKPIAVF